MTGIFGQFTNAKNSGADVPNETQDLCYSLSVTSEPVGSTAIWAISQDGTLSLTSGTLVNGTYVFECTVTDASSSCVLDTGSLSTTCSYELVFGTPPANQAICAGPTSELGLLDTSCPSSFGGTGLPLEVFFGANRFVNSGIAGTAGANIGSDTTTIMSTIDTALGALGPKYGFTSSNGLNLSYYNVLQEIRYGADKTECFDLNPSPPPTFLTNTPAYTTGALTQGIMAIQAILTKSATTGTQHTYKTNFTIVYRPTSSDAWQLATCLVGSPSQPAGGTVGNFNELEVLGPGATTASITYFFQNVGEYAVRNNGLHAVGCNNCDSCAEFTVNYYDAQQAQPVLPCTECLGPL
jgi:hypothetical protein